MIFIPNPYNKTKFLAVSRVTFILSKFDNSRNKSECCTSVLFVYYMATDAKSISYFPILSSFLQKVQKLGFG